MGYVKWMDELSKVLKIIFCIFYLDLTWMVYRIIKKVNEKNWAMMVVWILIAVFLGWIWWVVDLITVITQDKVIEFQFRKNILLTLYWARQDIFLLRKTLYKVGAIILLYLSNLAGVVKRPNTPGCEPGIRQFESDHSPHAIKNPTLLWAFIFKQHLE